MSGGLSLSVAVTLLASAAPVAYIGGGNALTLPAQRHLVRLVHEDGSESLFLALQQDGAGPGLSFFRSDDQGASWRFEAGIQPDGTHRDTADVITRGRDIALVYSYEGPRLSGSARHDVYFQWWRYDAASRTVLPSAPILVFDAPSGSEAYYRAELAIDSFGRIWVHAFHLGADGRHLAEVAVSANGGQTFSTMTPLANVPNRSGGRLLSLDGAMLFLYDQHAPLGPAWFRMRQDTDPLDAWTDPIEAFADGIYHGAALSAVKAGAGRFHLVYHDKWDDMLWYRFFDGSSFGPRFQVDDSRDWAIQPAAALHGSDMVIFYNRVRVPNLAYDLHARVLRNGVLEESVLLDGEAMFKGYPATLEHAPSTWPAVPCAFGFTIDANSGGQARVVFGSAWPSAPDGGAPDGGMPDGGAPDAGAPDAGAPDAGAPDAGAPDAGSSLSFEVVVEEKGFDFLAVATDGTALARRLGESTTRLYASSDGARTWSLRAVHRSSFHIISTLSDGTLIADVTRGGRHYLSRSTDTGRTWQDVLDIGTRRMLTPHSVAELDGTAYFAEYQTDTGADTPIRLWASTDQGRTWSVRFTFQGHRHAHGVRADAHRHALWVFFGDTTRQSGIYLSLDQGSSWTKMLGNQQGDVVDAVVTSGGLLFGQDISYLPDLPHIATLSFSGGYTPLIRIPGPSYSSFGLSSGGYVVGAARESGGDIYPPGEDSAHLYVSPDGISWTDAFQFRRASSQDTVRADVYWELPSGEIVLQLINASGFGQGGRGYQVLHPVRN